MPEILPSNVVPIVPKQLATYQQPMVERLPVQNKNTAVPSVQAIAPIKSRVETGGITQQISNANQQKSTSIGNVNVYPAKGDTNFVEQLEMYG